MIFMLPHDSDWNHIPAGALSAPAAQSGLHFICLNANIQRQFEFIQGAWLMGTKFNGLHEESDPLLGNRLPGAAGTRCDYFSMPQAGGPTQRLEGLPQFVTVSGGAYFFLPGIRALRFLAGTGARSALATARHGEVTMDSNTPDSNTPARFRPPIPARPSSTCCPTRPSGCCNWSGASTGSCGHPSTPCCAIQWPG